MFAVLNIFFSGSPVVYFGFTCITNCKLCVFFTQSEELPHCRHVYFSMWLWVCTQLRCSCLPAVHITCGTCIGLWIGRLDTVLEYCFRSISAGMECRNFISKMCRTDLLVIEKQDKCKQNKCDTLNLYLPKGKETLGISLVRHGLRKPSKAIMRYSRLWFSILQWGSLTLIIFKVRGQTLGLMFIQFVKDWSGRMEIKVEATYSGFNSRRSLDLRQTET